MSNLNRWLAAFFIFALPLLISPWNTRYGYAKSAFAIAMISLLLLVWGVGIRRKREGSFQLTKLFYPGLALIAVALVSLINASSLGIGLQSMVLMVYFMLFYLLLANLAAQEHHIHLFLGSVVAAAFLAAVYGILQYYGVLPGGVEAAKGPGAIISSIGNKNYLGGFLVCLVLPTLILPLRVRSWIGRTLSLLALGTIIYTLTLIKSDGAWLALGASGAFFIGGLLYFKLHRALKTQRGWMIIAAFLLFWGLLQVSAPPSDTPSGPGADALRSQKSLNIPIIDQLQKLWARNVDRARTWDWWIGWEMFKEHPLLGIGLGHYKVQFLPYKAKFLATERGREHGLYILRAGQAHNEYVQTAAEMGLLGILAGGFALVVILYSAWRRLRSLEPSQRLIALALLAGVVALLAHALVSFPLHLPASALDLALLLGLLNSRYLMPGQRKLKLTGLRGWVAAILVSSIVATTAVLGVRDFLADVHLQRGKAMLARGDDQRAEQELRRSIRLDFQPQSNLFYLGALYAKQMRYEESLRLFLRSLNCYVVEPTYWYLGTLNLELGNYDAALEHLALLVEIRPSADLNKRLPQPLGRLYDHAVELLRSGNEGKALRWFDTLAGLALVEQEKQLEAEYFRATIRIRQGQLGEGIALLEQLVAEEPAFWRAYVGLAQAYEMINKHAEASRYYAQALERIAARLTEATEELQDSAGGRRAELEAEIDQLEDWKERIDRLLQADRQGKGN